MNWLLELHHQKNTKSGDYHSFDDRFHFKMFSLSFHKLTSVNHNMDF
jgi:hypothetical protein